MIITKDKIFAFLMRAHISESGGGAEVQANFLAIELAKLGYKVYYICQTQHNSKANTSIKIDGVNIVWLKKTRRFAWVNQSSYLAKLKTINADIVIQRNSSHLSYVIKKYCEEKKAFFVWICTDNNSPHRNVHILEYKSQNSFKNTSKIKYIIFYLNALFMDMLRLNGLNGVSLAFTQNNYQKQILQREHKIFSSRMISAHPIEKKLLSPNHKFNNRTIIWCANLGRHKRPELFIKLAIKMTDSPFKFQLVGGHDNKEYVKNLLKNKPRNLTYIGKLDFNKTTKYFKEASIFISTSKKDKEGFPNTYIQSWRQGTPVISFGADPNDTIKINKLGHVSDNIDDAAKIIKNYLSDCNYYTDYYNRIINYNLKNHTTNVMTDNFLKILSKKY